MTLEIKILTNQSSKNKLSRQKHPKKKRRTNMSYTKKIQDLSISQLSTTLISSKRIKENFYWPILNFPKIISWPLTPMKLNLKKESIVKAKLITKLHSHQLKYQKVTSQVLLNLIAIWIHLLKFELIRMGNTIKY